MLSFAFAGVSIFFILVKGITFGNEKVEKWITSLLVSVLTSVFLTQPIQVALISVFFVTLFRKATDLYQKNDKEKESQFKGDHDDSRIRAKDIKDNSPPNSSELNEVRLEMLKNQQIKEIMKKILMHAVFLFVLFVVAYSNRDTLM